jgi:hypothetical protein
VVRRHASTRRRALLPTGSEPNPNAEAARWLDEALLLDSVYAPDAAPAAAAAAADAAAVGDGPPAEAEWELCDVQPLQPIPERPSPAAVRPPRRGRDVRKYVPNAAWGRRAYSRVLSACLPASADGVGRRAAANVKSARARVRAAELRTAAVRCEARRDSRLQRVMNRRT